MASRALPHATQALSVSPDARAVLMLAPLLLLFMQLRHSVEFIARDAPEGALIWAALASLLTLFLASIASYREIAGFAERFLRASAVFLVFFFVIEPHTMPRPVFPPDHPAVIFHTYGRWFGIALGLLGLWRPGFVAGGALLLFLIRELCQPLSGFHFSTLDIRNVAEVLTWVAVGIALLAGAARSGALRERLGLDATTQRRLALFIVAAGIGAHLGNYFWSALAKLAMDGGILSWLLDNDLRGHMLGSIEKRVLPYYASGELTRFVWDAVGVFNLPMQLASFALQAFALAAPWRRRWVMLATFGFDLFHLFIFATLGLFFFKWICLNLIILVTLTKIRDEEWDRTVAKVCIAFVVAGAAFFKTAMLAWYDSGNFVSPYFVAEMKDGSRIRLPSGYFASASYQVSQGLIHMPAGDRHFTPYVFGSTRRWKDYRAQEACTLPQRDRPDPERFASLALVGDFAAQAHAIALERADANGRFNWRWYPHHHVPWPFVPEPIEDADIRQIASYILVVESICQTMGPNGRVDRRVIARDEWPVHRVPQ